MISGHSVSDYAAKQLAKLLIVVALAGAFLGVLATKGCEVLSRYTVRVEEEP